MINFFSKLFNVTNLTYVALFFTVLGLIATIITALKTKKNLSEISAQNDKLETQIQELERLSKSIADYTRKPLRGIEEIFYQCYNLLENTVRKKGNFWFVGLTLGFGPPHKYRQKIKNGATCNIDDIIKEKWPDAPNIETMIENFNSMLMGVIGGSKSTIVCLGREGKGHKEDIVREKFIKQLTERNLYKTLKKNEEMVVNEIIQLHSKVEKRVDSDRPVKYIESIPLQIIVAEIPSGDPPSPVKRACIVYHVGTENIESSRLDDGESGFYSELDSICNMFIDVTESLYNQ